MADNNMIQVNRQLFKKLEEILPSDHSTYNSLVLGDKAIRHIKTDEKEELVLKEVGLKYDLIINETTSCYVLEFQNRSFFVVTGDESQYDYVDVLNGLAVLSLDEEYITHTNSGLSTFLWSQNNFPFSNEGIGLELIESVFCREGKIKGEFDYQELKLYFKEHYIWEIDIEIYNNINKYVIYSWFSAIAIKSSSTKLSLDFSIKTQNNFLDIIDNSPMDLLGVIIYRSLFSISWNYSFLELYRCIEFLYPIPYLKEFSHCLGDSNLFKEMYIKAETMLDWRPKEINSLERLIRDYGDTNTEVLDFKKCFELIDGRPFEEGINTAPAIAKRIYKLRNSIAHFRLNLAYQIENKEDFDRLIGCMLAFIYTLYQKYEVEISSIKSHAN